MTAAPRVIDLPVIGELQMTTIVSKGIGVVVVVFAALVLYALGRRVIAKTPHPKYLFTDAVRARADTTRSTLVSLWRYLVVFGALAAILAMLPSTFAHAVVLTGLGGVLLLLVAQALFRDVIAGLSILLEGQFAVGDRVRLFGVDVEGTVEDVGLRITVLKEDSGSRVFVPNGTITAVRAIEGAASGKPEDGRRARGGRARTARTRPPSREERPRQPARRADAGDADEDETAATSSSGDRPRTRRGGRRGRRGGRGRRPAGASTASADKDAQPQAGEPEKPETQPEPEPQVNEPRVPEPQALEPQAPKAEPVAEKPEPVAEKPEPVDEEPRDILSDSPWSID